MSTKYKEIGRQYIIPFDEGIKLTVGMKVGSPLTVSWDKNVKANPQALKVLYHGTKIGYVSSFFHQNEIHEEHKKGKRIYAYLVEDNRADPTRPPLYVGFKCLTDEAHEDDVPF